MVLADVKLCAARLALEPGACIQRLQAIEVTLGEMFRTRRPYALWPLGDYFKSRIPGGARRCPVPVFREQERGPLHPPLARLSTDYDNLNSGL